MICQSCRDRAAVAGTALCRTCAAAEERADRRARPSYYHARSRAGQIDAGDYAAAAHAWNTWSLQDGIVTEPRSIVGSPCVATLDGVRYLAGIIVGAIDGAAWVWLLDPPRDWELRVPIVKAAIEGVEIVERKKARA